jgi:plasmid stability protein
MATLVIESFPEDLYARLKKTAAAHQRSVPQETIRLLEVALALDPRATQERNGASYWSTRNLLPAFEAALRSGAFSGGTDSAEVMSDERDAR